MTTYDPNNRYDIRNYELLRIRVNNDECVHTILTLDLSDKMFLVDENAPDHDQLDFTVPSLYATKFIEEIADNLIGMSWGNDATTTD